MRQAYESALTFKLTAGYPCAVLVPETCRRDEPRKNRQTMKTHAIVQRGPRRLEYVQLPLPETLAPDEALVRVEGCGICGTDYERYEGSLGHIPELIPGHEPVGRIERIGDSAAQRMQLKVGDRVAVQPHYGCGVCAYCVEGMFQLCARKINLGLSPLSEGCGLWGGFAGHMMLKGNAIVHKMPDSLPIEDAVMFNPLGAGFEWAITSAGTRVGDDVLIFGPGQRGLACVIAAVIAGANRIVVTGLQKDAYKLELARSLGATEVVAVDPADPASLARALEGQRFDRVIDVTPVATQPILDAIALVRPGGTIVLAGLKGNTRTVALRPDDLVMDGIEIKGVRGISTRSYGLAVRAICSGAYDFSAWHTHTMALKDAELAIRILAGEVRQGPEPLHITIVP
ncbi:oxidoreductase, zinc-binding dehydrogenase family protein [Bordetella bronchiseptica GA96-01]|nr:oxidoreductase, zinc-binding dehydrogenase family protein [Bordetella bronchiseptica 345]KDC38505.1 oxidoreductase, zinc-binding dehydrogenase family protein [Bordetella bronchiseptica GA96-01]